MRPSGISSHTCEVFPNNVDEYLRTKVPLLIEATVRRLPSLWCRNSAVSPSHVLVVALSVFFQPWADEAITMDDLKTSLGELAKRIQAYQPTEQFPDEEQTYRITLQTVNTSKLWVSLFQPALREAWSRSLRTDIPIGNHLREAIFGVPAIQDFLRSVLAGQSREFVENVFVRTQLSWILIHRFHPTGNRGKVSNTQAERLKLAIEATLAAAGQGGDGQGQAPVFICAEGSVWNLCSESVENSLKQRTRAVIRLGYANIIQTLKERTMSELRRGRFLDATIWIAGTVTDVYWASYSAMKSPLETIWENNEAGRAALEDMDVAELRAWTFDWLLEVVHHFARVFPEQFTEVALRHLRWIQEVWDECMGLTESLNMLTAILNGNVFRQRMMQGPASAMQAALVGLPPAAVANVDLSVPDPENPAPPLISDGRRYRNAASLRHLISTVEPVRLNAIVNSNFPEAFSPRLL
ncbi:hypothetical protein NMY22_g14875 [Coprinellus aureogranulatus]|nr:hypothetical protein NMY22_g14875 [Coprinellus aureogranulatus]